jgi:hypothetical protein
MATFSYRDRLYEVLKFGPVDEPGVHYECWDLTDDSHEFVGRIIAPSIDGPDDVFIDLLSPVAAGVLKRWMQIRARTL